MIKVCYTGSWKYEVWEVFILRSAKVSFLFFLMVALMVTGVVFRLLENTSHRSYCPGVGLPSGEERDDHGIPGKSEEMLHGNYRVDPRTTSKEDLLPLDGTGNYAREKLARSLNDPAVGDGSTFDSGDIPPRIRGLADQLIDLKNELDDSTLDTVNSALDHLPLIEVKADSAELRPSGDGIRLKVIIPADNISIREE